jgi:hypothetical protein
MESWVFEKHNMAILCVAIYDNGLHFVDEHTLPRSGEATYNLNDFHIK